ncbi:MAG: hypothetical protein ABI343_21950 [Burkholderiaceae bacterium]
MPDSNRLFIDLSPPPGGLQRLQHRVAGNDHAAGRRRLWIPVGAAFATSLLVLVSLLPGVIARQQQTDKLISALHESLAPPADGIQVVDGAALELPSGNSEVRLYLVQSAAPTPHDGAD